MPPEEHRPLPVIVKLKSQKMREVVTLDLRDGLNPPEAALLAVMTNPYIVSIREKKGQLLPQLITAGVLPPPRIEAGKGGVADSWLPTKRRKLLKVTASRLMAASPDGQLELESAWLEWQAGEAARLFLYRKLNSRRVINLLRQISKVYKEIYKTTSKAEYKERYAKQRAIAKLGYRKMKKTGRQEEKELSSNRRGLNHALGLQTNIDSALEPGVAFNISAAVPGAKELMLNLQNGRIDFMALQSGIASKNLEFMNYILSRFNPIYISIQAKTEAQWLDANGYGVYMAFPLFETGHGVAPLVPTNGKLLAKNYSQRVNAANSQIPRLVKGIGLISTEIERIDKILPDLQKAASPDKGEKSPVEKLLKKKTFLAVSLLRTRLLRKLMDAGLALEAASGTIIFEAQAR